MFSKVYVEITNVCNLRCPFCHGTKRTPGRMTAEEFSTVTDKLRGYTEYIYYHVLGEPLTHPDLPTLFDIAAEKGFFSCITTNGFLLGEKADILCGAKKLYKLSVSLHSFEANKGTALREYLDTVWSVCTRLAEKGTYCVLRLWNEGGINTLNGEITAYLREKTTGEWTQTRNGSLRIAKNIYLETAAKFDWPDVNAPERNVQFCRGLRDQAAILCDGTVVPCCLDADGSIPLGNIFETELGDILCGERAAAMYEGFSERRCTEELCRKCGFAERFSL